MHMGTMIYLELKFAVLYVSTYLQILKPNKVFA